MIKPYLEAAKIVSTHGVLGEVRAQSYCDNPETLCHLSMLYLDPQGLAVKVAENPSVQVLREKFADEHAVGVICWLEIDSKVEKSQMIAKLVMKAAAGTGGGEG